jgi:hypothetical protein
MKTNTNLPAFHGFYGSIFEDFDNYSELQYVNELRDQNGLEPLENDYDFDYDYEDYHIKLSIALCDTVESFLIDEGFINSIKFINLHSPKYYNYSNDTIECNIDVNVKNVKEYINNNLDCFEAYLIDNFKSYSGFCSFYEHDLNFWLNKMKSFKNLDHNEIHGILDFICKNESFDIVDSFYNRGYYNIQINITNFNTLTNE